MRLKSSDIKTFISAFKLATLIYYLKITSEIVLSEEEKNPTEEVNKYIPEIYTDKDLEDALSKVIIEKQLLLKRYNKIVNLSSSKISSLLIRIVYFENTIRRLKYSTIILSIALLVSIVGIILLLVF